MAWATISVWVILLPQNQPQTVACDCWFLYSSLYLSVLELYYSKGAINTSDQITVFFVPTTKSHPVISGSPCRLSHADSDKLTYGHQCPVGLPIRLPHHLCCQCQLLLEKLSHVGPSTTALPLPSGCPTGTVAPEVRGRAVVKMGF